MSHACPGRLRLQPPSLELPEPPACRCRDARVRSHSCPYLGISGPSNQRGGAGPDPPTPPPRRVPPGLSRSRRRSPLRRRRRAMSSSQFNKGPSYGLSAEVKNRVSRAGGRGGAGTNGGLRAEKSRGCSEGPDALRRVRSRVRGAACAGAALRSWGALTLSRGAPGVWEGSRAPAAPTLAPVPPGSLRGAGGGEWGDGSGSVQLCSRGFPTLCFPIIPCPSGRDVVPLGGP